MNNKLIKNYLDDVNYSPKKDRFFRITLYKVALWGVLFLTIKEAIFQLRLYWR